MTPTEVADKLRNHKPRVVVTTCIRCEAANLIRTLERERDQAVTLLTRTLVDQLTINDLAAWEKGGDITWPLKDPA